MPRWVLYQSRSLAGSLDLMKTPPIPVTRCMTAFSVLSAGSEALFIGFCESFCSGFFSEAFGSEAGAALFSGAFTPEAGSRSWARIQQMGRVMIVKAVNKALVFIYKMQCVMMVMRLARRSGKEDDDRFVLCD